MCHYCRGAASSNKKFNLTSAASFVFVACPLRCHKNQTTPLWQVNLALCSSEATVNDDSRQDTYIICSTPRTGSTLLCELLASTGLAGNPHSYFRSQDIEKRSSEWELQPQGGFPVYLEAVRRLTSTPNSVLGLRVMWGTLDEILGELRSLRGNADDIILLEKEFGRLRFIHLTRGDVVGQAISLYKAEKSDYWHSTQPGIPCQSVHYNFDEIAKRIESLRNDNAAWLEWFESVGVEPLSVSYEELELDPQATADRVLRYLGLEYSGTTSAPNKKLADGTTDEWRDRFLREMGAT